MAEAFNSLYKAELVRNRDPWRGLDDLEIATVEYIDGTTTGASTANSGTSRPPSTKRYTR